MTDIRKIFTRPVEGTAVGEMPVVRVRAGEVEVPSSVPTTIRIEEPNRVTTITTHPNPETSNESRSRPPRPRSPSFRFRNGIPLSSCTLDPPKKSHKSKGIYFNKVMARGIAKAETDTRLRFSDYIERILRGVGSGCFEYARRGSPIAGKGVQLRGTIAERVARRFFERMGCEVGDADASLRVDGRLRRKGTERYDFKLVEGGRKYDSEVKLSRANFNKGKDKWAVKFGSVKPDQHDRLFLVVEGVDEWRIYEWGGKNMFTNGKKTSWDGEEITVSSSWHQPDFEVAYPQLVEKMDARNTLLATIRFDDPAYADLLSLSSMTEDHYDGVPLWSMSSKSRGDALENLVRCVLEDKGLSVTDAARGTNVNGAANGSNTTPNDFDVGADKAEAKGCVMSWNKSGRCFELQFNNVKLDEHDRLFLAWLTPSGIHIFEHVDRKIGYSTAGEKTESQGGTIIFRAPGGDSGFDDPSDAEDFLLRQFRHMKDTYVAFVSFAPGDADRVMEVGKRVCGAGEEPEEDSDGD